ncbi:hypothetical protein BJ322DRAFT_851774 [Thelephora terrestris]|uniref:NACHT domain-containing protein n=1 Tax=Thelephora terrestris TaxID=56493 RepID=A0A9P6L693_9AGAM|nr:hypothetical protein BJ322DRAFT_851774 [Thelephora terrestris]
MGKAVREKAKALRERVTAEGHASDEGDIVAVSKLADDLRDILLEYWMAQQQAIHDQNCRLIDAADLLVLSNCRRAQGAEYCHGDRRGCLKGTRDTVLSEIETWAEDFDKSPVFWLNGLAGTGKSTIAQTISERLFAEARLGASFFCSRDFEDRSNLRFILPTLAFQLAHKYSDFRSHLVPLLRSNPDVVHESLYNQMKKLIAEPLQAANISTVIVIDALDECKDDEPSSAVLSVLGRFVERIPEVKFFITGRPEPRIKTGFRLPLLVDWTDVFVLHNVPLSLVNDDIRLFLKHELSELARRRQLERWPSDEHVNVLRDRAAGLFVYAVATVKFLGSNIHLPKNRLAVILKLPESTIPEGKTRFNPNTTLDSLYTSILEAAIGEGDPDVDFKVRTTVGAVVLVVNPLPPPAIAELMDLDSEEVILFLTKIQSLLAIGEDFSQPVKPFHRSFPDFITDPSRCANSRFYISPEYLHCEIVTNCLRVMNDRLEQNLLSLPEYALNSEVEDLQSRIENRVSSALQYACRSWHNHLTTSRRDFTDVTTYLRTFLEKNFLAWLEVLSVLGDVGGAAIGLEKLMSWLQEVSQDDTLLNTARDCFNFVTKFFEPINVSATHIYHSALELCPISSIVRRLYYERCRTDTCLPRVVVGAPDSWDQAVSFSNKDQYVSCIWSPCGLFIAAQTPETVEIRDQLTAELLTTLQPPETICLKGPLAYSPDGRSLACASDTSILIWDIQTGGVAGEICCGFETSSMVWSLDGSEIGLIESGGVVHRHDFTSNTTWSPGRFSPEDVLCLVAHEKSFQILVTPISHESDSATVEVFEFGHTLTMIRSFGVNQAEGYLLPRRVSYSPATRCFAFSISGKLQIFDNQNSCHTVELAIPGDSNLSPLFSPDGSLLATSKDSDEIFIWKYASGNWMQWKNIRCEDLEHITQFSPSQSSILCIHGDIVRGLRLDDVPSTPEIRPQWWIRLSRSGSYIATAYESEATVTIIDLNSRPPPRLIDTGVKIKGLALTGNILLVLGLDTVVGWLLREGGRVGGVFSVWTIPIAHYRNGPEFAAEGHVGMIGLGDPSKNFIYDTNTGDILQPDKAPGTHRGYRYSLRRTFCGQDYLDLHNMPPCNTPPEGGWQTTKIAVRDGWVKDPEGGHRLWLPVEWRAFWDLLDWRHDIATQFSIITGEPVVVKF